jgi:hypothetical protein
MGNNFLNLYENRTTLENVLWHVVDGAETEDILPAENENR